MIHTFETILIGTSLTEASDPVVRSGVLLARRTGGRVHLAHAYPIPFTSTGAPFAPEASFRDSATAERATLQRQVDEQMARLGLDRAELAGVHLEIGPAHRDLVETAGKIRADLIVVGSSESPRLSKVFGSTADRVVRKAICPVLVVRDELRFPLRRILLPVDLSPLSAEAFEAGLRFLVWIGGEAPPAVEALFVVTELDRQALTSRAETESAEELAERSLRRFIVENASGVTWKIETLVESGFVDAEILHRIETAKPDLAVLGTHGRSGFERLLLGSVASTVIREGTCNVLVIPPREALPEGAKAEMAAEVLT